MDPAGAHFYACLRLRVLWHHSVCITFVFAECVFHFCWRKRLLCSSLAAAYVCCTLRLRCCVDRTPTQLPSSAFCPLQQVRLSAAFQLWIISGLLANNSLQPSQLLWGWRGVVLCRLVWFCCWLLASQ